MSVAFGERTSPAPIFVSRLYVLLDCYERSAIVRVGKYVFSAVHVVTETLNGKQVKFIARWQSTMSTYDWKVHDGLWKVRKSAGGYVCIPQVDECRRVARQALFCLASIMSGSSLQFWRPGTLKPGSNVDRATEVEDNVVPSAPASASLSIQAQRERLPIYKHSNVKSPEQI